MQITLKWGEKVTRKKKTKFLGLESPVAGLGQTLDRAWNAESKANKVRCLKRGPMRGGFDGKSIDKKTEEEERYF